MDIFETPVTVTPQRKISKTLNSSKIPLKFLTFTTFGRQRSLLGILEDFRVFEILFFVAGGFWDSMGRGARGGFSKIS